MIWKSQSDRAGYSSAIPVEVNGGNQVVFFTHQRAVGLDLKDGSYCGEYAKPANDVANAATPIARGNRVFISSDYGTVAVRSNPTVRRRRFVYKRDA